MAKQEVKVELFNGKKVTATKVSNVHYYIDNYSVPDFFFESIDNFKLILDFGNIKIYRYEDYIVFSSDDNLPAEIEDFILYDILNTKFINISIDFDCNHYFTVNEDSYSELEKACNRLNKQLNELTSILDNLKKGTLKIADIIRHSAEFDYDFRAKDYLLMLSEDQLSQLKLAIKNREGTEG